jgi:malate synthase
LETIKNEVGPDIHSAGRFLEALELFREISINPEFIDFLTIPAYRLID